MRSNIELDEELLQRAKDLTEIKTTEVVIQVALETLVRLREPANPPERVKKASQQNTGAAGEQGEKPG